MDMKLSLCVKFHALRKFVFAFVTAYAVVYILSLFLHLLCANDECKLCIIHCSGIFDDGV